MSHTATGAWLHRQAFVPLLIPILVLLPTGRATAQSPDRAAGERPVGVAFGGGSARGIAHVGVIRWFEEHHVPIDVAAGTSMGGLIGGAFAVGMDADEIEAMLAGIDWDAMFGSSNFEFKNVRRKADSRAYPSHLEFGLKDGFKPPTSINNGQQVDLLIARITAPYYGLSSFDDLPTPFRTVAVDLKKARPVVLHDGSLAVAMRATMSLPLIFPPVELDGQVLVDGGVMDNVPADVVRNELKAARVIAVNVGELSDKEQVDYSMLGLAGETLDAMMRANSLRALDAADIVINVPLKEFGSLDWRRHAELIAAGYQAAEAMKDELLPLAVDETTWRGWLAQRAARRRTALPRPATVIVEGAARNDTKVLETTLAKHIDHVLDVGSLEADITRLGGLDRYQSLDWSVRPTAAGDVLEIDAREKKYGPPFVMLGFTLENITTNDVRFGVAGRYVGYDLVGSGSELRVDVQVGSEQDVAFELYRPLGTSPVFVAPNAGATRHTVDHVVEDRLVASYNETLGWVGFDAGVNPSRIDEVRIGIQLSRFDATVKVGDPGLPELRGRKTVAELQWTHDGQDSPVVPSRGLYATASLRYFLDAPEAASSVSVARRSNDVTQAEVHLNRIWSFRERGRLFFLGGGGTSFDGRPLPTEQFAVGGPFRLGALNVGERRGDHFVNASVGYLHEAMRLPDFVGGPLFVGGWLDVGDAFDAWEEAEAAVQVSVGAIVDTLFGPAFVATSAGFDGRWRAYFGIGRVF